MSGAHLEITTSYDLAKEVAAIVPPPSFGDVVKTREDAFDVLDAQTRQKIWDVKCKLDSIPEKVYYATRDEIFPLAHTGTKMAVKFKNRAGHKLNQSMEATGVWEQLKSLGKKCSFADVCGGPGAFSQALYAGSKPHGLMMKGFGMTLMYSHLDAPQGWYPELTKKHKFQATFGIDGTGNIYRNDNVEALASMVATEPLRLVVADGGFDVPFNIANYQEVISNRIVYGQWYTAVKILAKGGCFVLKLFDTYAPFTRSVLYLSLFAFDKVHIVKPKHSRVVNSERYLVCVGFNGLSDEWMSYLDRFHKDAFPSDDNLTPLSVVSCDVMAADKAFTASITAMNTGIAEKQEFAIEHLLASPVLEENKDLYRRGEQLGVKRKRDQQQVEEAEAKKEQESKKKEEGSTDGVTKEEGEEGPKPPEQRSEQ